jgi:hypothetical protein
MLYTESEDVLEPDQTTHHDLKPIPGLLIGLDKEKTTFRQKAKYFEQKPIFRSSPNFRSTKLGKLVGYGRPWQEKVTRPG